MATQVKFDPIPLMAWAKEYGPPPRDYTCIDSETTGIDPVNDKILNLGYCVVQDGKPTLSVDLVVDWTAVMTAQELKELDRRMSTTRERMLAKNKAYPWTIDFLRKRGRPPAEVVSRFLTAIGTNPCLIGHYAMMLDLPLIGRMAAKYGAGLDVDMDRLYDTGLWAKACLISLSPAKGEDRLAYIRRIHDVRFGPKHSLEACVDRFGLAAQGVDKKHQHTTASYDSWLVALLVEKFRDYMPESVPCPKP